MLQNFCLSKFFSVSRLFWGADHGGIIGFALASRFFEITCKICNRALNVCNIFTAMQYEPYLIKY